MSAKYKLPDRLYHYTCSDHGEPGIRRDGFLKPGPVTGLVWMTDLDVPLREPLGLTSNFAKCDRTAVRFEVARCPEIFPWFALRRLADPDVVHVLENSPGAMPMHWFVSKYHVEIVKEAAREYA